MQDRKLFTAHILPNGITVYSHAMDVPYFSLHIIAPVGSAHSHEGNPDGRFGIAHFMEHAIFNRSERYPERGAFEKLISLKGGYWNAVTGPRMTDVHVTAPVDTQQEAVEGLVSHMLHPILTEEDLSTERGIVRNERDQRRYYPADSEETQYLSLDWMRDQWYSREQLFGTDADLNAMTPQTIQAFLRHYAAHGLQVVVGGGHVLEPILETFAAISTKTMPLTERLESIGWANRTYHEKAFQGVGTPTYCFGSIASRYNLRESYALRFMLGLLANHVHGPLYEWLRKEKGWTYGIEYETATAADRTEVALRIPLNTLEAVLIIRTELHDRIGAALADTELIERERSRRAHARLFYYQTLDDRMSEAVDELDELGRIVSEHEYEELMEASARPASLREAYETYLAPTVSGEMLLLPQEHEMARSTLL